MLKSYLPCLTELSKFCKQQNLLLLFQTSSLSGFSVPLQGHCLLLSNKATLVKPGLTSYLACATSVQPLCLKLVPLSSCHLSILCV